MAGYRDELERLNFSAEEKEALTCRLLERRSGQEEKRRRLLHGDGGPGAVLVLEHLVHLYNPQVFCLFLAGDAEQLPEGWGHPGK